MNTNEMGLVFGLLMKYREIHGNPQDRPLRDGELSAAHILSNCSQTELAAFDDFLEAQGYTLYIRDAIELGVPPKNGRPNILYVLTRKRGSELAPYLNNNWFLEQMRDGRSSSTKQELVFWITRLWLTMQWFFYQRIDRIPSEISLHRQALISEGLFMEVIAQGIEKLGNEGRPDGDSGLMWDALWNGKRSMKVYVSRFMKVMELAGMIEGAGNLGEYRQTLLAAIEMAEIADNDLAYLMPPASNEEVTVRSMEMLMGAVNNQEGDEYATNSTH